MKRKTLVYGWDGWVGISFKHRGEEFRLTLKERNIIIEEIFRCIDKQYSSKSPKATEGVKE